MHHQDFSGDPAGTGSRKMSLQATFHNRRGSSGASASSSAAGGSTVVAGDDNTTQAGSSSPGMHHQPQPQGTGAQVKKKSGFQITSVTPAQINVSANNSLADDTESYDDMDESHTEDLSSSDMLDVSVSRATDTGVPERSSSDETLNSLHGVDTPALMSPNEPLHPQSILQGSQSQPSMVNGNVHHHHPSQQPSHSHHQHGHHSDNMGGAQLPAATGGTPAVALLASSSPVQIPTAGPVQSQRPPMLDNTVPAGDENIPLATVVGGAATDTVLPGSMNITNVSGVTAMGMPLSGPTGFESAGVGGQGTSTGVGTVSVFQAMSPAPNTQSQHTQTQAAPGSRFRVVKLDTNSEPFRKGRWTCTEYYEKEIPHATTSEAHKGAEAAAETEPGVAVASPGPTTLQPPQTLQPYQQPSQDFTSPQAMQSPPQGLAQMPPQEVVGAVHMVQQPMVAPPVTLPAATPQVMAQGNMSQPPSVMPQQLPYAVDPHQASSQVGYPTPQLSAGVVPPGGGRQPDFIQPTAPFQTQVQPPLPHVTTGVPMTVGPGGGPQPPVANTQQLALQGQSALPAQASFTPAQLQHLPAQLQQQHQQQLHPQNPQARAQPPFAAPGLTGHNQGTHYVPLTALQADLQPLLTPGATLSQMCGVSQAPGSVGPLKTTHLEDAQRLLLQHQGLLALPRFGTSTGGHGIMEGGSAAGALAHIGMSAEASALMAAAAGLRTQPAEGDEDR
ncbi:uncharacterized protein ACJ7VT_020101 [Polymixia lowei]